MTQLAFMSRSIRAILCVVALAVTAAACDSIPLFAPSESTITISSATRILPINGSAEITAVVLERGGTPVQNGTTVRFSTSLGRVDPVEVQTTNGIALATNAIRFTIGAAAASTISVRANPSAVPATGGTVDIIAVVLGENGQPLTGVPVTFSATQGSLSSGSANTSASGEATVRLTTSLASTVTASAGNAAVTPATVDVAVLGSPAVTLTCQAAATSCSETTGTTISFTAMAGTGSTVLTTATLEFGDGTSTSLGGLTGATTVNHTYSSVGTYTATLRATDVNGQTATASVAITITAAVPLSITFSTVTGATASTPPAAGVQNGQLWTFVTAVLPATTPITSYTWDFGDGTAPVVTSGGTTTHVYTGGVNANGTKIVTVTARAQDGRTVDGRVEIIVSGLIN